MAAFESERISRSQGAELIIIGVDPGTAVTGYGIIRKVGNKPCRLASGVVKTSADAPQSKRILEIYSRLDEVIREHQPDVMVVESLFHAVNPQSLMKLCQVRGGVLLLGERYGLDIFEYSPMEIKQGLTGYGRADKNQILFMVAHLLGLNDLKRSDEADALAMALYHSHIARPLGKNR
ncbi:MAG: crossover junction endodeoxyribonuclease RuvC [Pseudomonadota bacterium]